MGRIDEALRVAGVGSAEPPSAAADARGVFVSPWMIGPRQVEHSASAPIPDRENGRDLPSVPPPVRVNRPSSLDGFKPGWRERLTTAADADPMLVDQFRRLAARLLHAQREVGLRSVLVTSAAAGDGKTLTALNLALILSNSYRRRVLLVEADLRRPVIAQAANIATVTGLSDTINAGSDSKVTLIELTDTLTLIPAGRPDPDPLSGLTSPAIQRLLQESAERFDWVIVDTPPIGAVADASLLCPLVDAAIFVICAGRTPYAAVEKSIETLGRDRIFGVVLNQMRDGTAASADYYSYYQHHRDEEPQ